MVSFQEWAGSQLEEINLVWWRVWNDSAKNLFYNQTIVTIDDLIEMYNLWKPYIFVSHVLVGTTEMYSEPCQTCKMEPFAIH